MVKLKSIAISSVLIALMAPVANAQAVYRPSPTPEQRIQRSIDILYSKSGHIVSKATLRAEATKKAKAVGYSLVTFLDRVVKEAEAATPRFVCFNKGIPNNSAKYQLPQGKHVGDVFISTSGFMYFGHAGLYVKSKTIEEAPGPKKKSRVRSIKGLKVGCGSVLESPQAKSKTLSKRSSAVAYAQKRLVGREYNAALFWWNKYSKGSVNCSQLVWLAYRAGAGWDIDRNGGWAVYPWDLYHSAWVYKVVK